MPRIILRDLVASAGAALIGWGGAALWHPITATALGLVLIAGAWLADRAAR
jgi:hypothetical protein